MMALNESVNHAPFRHKYYRHLWYWFFVPVYLTYFFLAEHWITDSYWVSYLPIDDKIPFLPIFVIPYVLWYPFMAALGVYLSFRDVAGMRRYAICLMTCFFSAVTFCLLFPNGQDLRPVAFEQQNIFTELIGALYASDTNTNVLPSMHVLGSTCVVFGVFHCKYLKRLWLRLGTVMLALLICAATVLIKQHSILDAYIAIPWVLVIYLCVYHLPKWLRFRRKVH